MLNITIQNDGKIKFQSECSSTKEMRSNVNLLLAVVSSMEMEEKANKNAKRDPVQMKRLDDGKCDLVLTWVDQNRKLLAVKELKENIELWLRDAKGYIDSYCAGKKVILLTGDEDEIEKAAKKFESSECLRVCISKH